MNKKQTNKFIDAQNTAVYRNPQNVVFATINRITQIISK
jgi:hypothetical protein